MTKPRLDGQVKRFSLPSRIAHWSHALFFLVLFATGLGLVFKGVVGIATLKLFGEIHRMAAWPFTFVAVIVLLLGTPKNTLRWLASAFNLDADDKKFLKLFPKEFFGKHVEMPPQGKFNAGEKINSLLQVTGWIVLVVTGWVLVLKADQPEIHRWALVIHSCAALLTGTAALGHIYMAVGLPGSRPALSGMISGMVSKKWAFGHHKKWADEVTK